MTDHRTCPNCSETDTNVVHVSWFGDYAERVRTCESCQTQWTVSYGHPTISAVDSSFGTVGNADSAQRVSDVEQYE